MQFGQISGWRCAARALLVLLLGVFSLAAQVQEQPPKKSTENAAEPEAAKAVTLPADALQFAARLGESASEEVRKWCRDLAKQKRRDADVDIATFSDAASLQFPRASAASRDAIIFLALYEGYRAAEHVQEGTAALLKETERAIERTESRLRFARGGRRADFESDLADLDVVRRTRAGAVQNAGKDVDKYLKAIAEFYPRVKGSDPAVLRSLP
jgi:MoxR-like ATPase